MAEGHVVRRNAERFHRALAGQRVAEARWRSKRVRIAADEVVGRRVERVDFAGKNHLFELDDGSLFRVHFMMYGSAQVGAPEEPLLKPAARVRFLLASQRARVAVFSAPIVEHYSAGQPRLFLEALGPDALKEPFDRRDFARRMATTQDATVAEALLNPSVVAGVGNIYKSEALWRAGIHPLRAPSSLREDEAVRLAKVVPSLMLAAYRSLGNPGRRREHVKVYQRVREPCPRCGAPIAGQRVGGRGTFWCARCQPDDGSPRGLERYAQRDR